jgi:cell wall-associated NlpC family hydrolase
MSIELLKHESYLKMIRNSVGTKMFKNLYLKVDGKKIDATHNGILSCAYFVSNILLVWGLIKEGHANVESTIEAMLKNGWKKIPKNKIRPGDVIVWEKKKKHLHCGFYIGDKKTISNSEFKKTPAMHSWDYNGKRKIIVVYKCPLNK